MSKLKWEDVTSFRSIGNVPESNFHLKTEEITICIVSNHKDYKGEWIMHCYDLKLTEFELGFEYGEPIENVQKEAIRIIKDKLMSMYDSL